MTSVSSLSPLALWDTMHVLSDGDTGRCNGLGFVEMPDCQAVQAAMVGLRGQECVGRLLTVRAVKGCAPHRAARRVGRRWAIHSPCLLAVHTPHALVDRCGQTPAEAGAARPRVSGCMLNVKARCPCPDGGRQHRGRGVWATSLEATSGPRVCRPCRRKPLCLSLAFVSPCVWGFMRA